MVAVPLAPDVPLNEWRWPCLVPHATWITNSGVPPARAPQPPLASAKESALARPPCFAQRSGGRRFFQNRGRPHQAEAAPPPLLAALAYVRQAQGMENAALITLTVGWLCVVVAICLSSSYPAATVLEWQAIQLCRTQWILASVAALLAGILLKNVR